MKDLLNDSFNRGKSLFSKNETAREVPEWMSWVGISTWRPVGDKYYFSRAEIGANVAGLVGGTLAGLLALPFVPKGVMKAIGFNVGYWLTKPRIHAWDPETRRESNHKHSAMYASAISALTIPLTGNVLFGFLTANALGKATQEPAEKWGRSLGKKKSS